jgi:SecD/SecF fusion protein
LRSRGNISIIVLVLALLGGTLALALQRSVTLGLDLRGGSEVVLKALPDPGVTLTPAMMEQARQVYENRINGLGLSEPSIQVENTDEITIQSPGEKNPERLNSLIGSAGLLYFIDLQKGLTPGVSRSVVVGAGSSIAPKTTLYELLKGTQGLADGKFSSYYAFTTATKAVLLNGQSAKTRGQLQDLLLGAGIQGTAGQEQLGVPLGKLAAWCQPTANHGCPGDTEAAPTGNKLGKKVWYMFDLPAKDVLLTGKYLDNAQADIDTGSGQPIVTMSFNDTGLKMFATITKQLAHDGKADYDRAGGAATGASAVSYAHQFAIVLDGEIATYPYIDFQANPDGISSNPSQITGVTQTESHDIATILSSGSLPVEFVRISQTSVSATLGKTSLDQGLIAGAAGLGIVMLYMIFYYRFLGLIADLALAIYAALYLGVILLANVTLTLPGIAGLILTIGVAADANVVVFERIKEEVRAGMTVRSAIAGGYTKGFKTIIDANVVTMITASVLFVASTSSVKGFALLLAIGVIVSMFTAVAATRAMLGVLGGFRWFNNAAFMGATAKPVRWKYDFGGRTRLWFAVSGAIIVAGLGSIGVSGLNKGLDFTGGTRISFPLTNATATVDQVRSSIAGVDQLLREAVIQGTGAATGDRYGEFQIASKELTPDKVSAVEDALTKTFGSTTLQRQKVSVSSYSAAFGSQILQNAVLAFVFSILLIVIYLAFRFDWRYSLPTIAALIHDLLVTVGVYSITGREVTSATVAAVLTILGYSLYDTIIVFDRVRENERVLRKHSIQQIVNISLWETMTRSLNTSFITLLPLLSLFFFGGATLKDFAFALLIGIVSGAYSSFFIASPLLVMLKLREPEYARRTGTDELPAMFRPAATVSEDPASTRVSRPVTAPPADDRGTQAARQRRLDRRGK